MSQVVQRIRSFFGGNGQETADQLRKKLGTFRDLVEKNDHVLELIADAGEKLGGEYVFDHKYLNDLVTELRATVHRVVEDLNVLTGNRHLELRQILAGIDERVQAALECRSPVLDAPWILPLTEVGVEHADLVGEKIARLGEIGSRLGCRTPPGFVVTTAACRSFLDAAEVDEAAEALAARTANADPEEVEAEAARIQERILAARVPKEVERSIRQEVERLRERDPQVLFAVRSSAAEEDGTLTFAGQFETVLAVAPDDVVDAYRRVVSSLFSPAVVRYQRVHDLPPGCGLMAVGCLAMVPARASGVAYTLNPSEPAARSQLVTSTWGLGKAVVEGEAPVDRFEVVRQSDYPVAEARIAEKTWRYVADPNRGLVREPVPERQQRVPSLDEATISELADVACRIERYMKAAQDIEWAVDDDGQLFILQARPLSIPPTPLPSDADLSGVVEHYPVLMQGKGEVVCRGIAVGRVHILDPENPGTRVPPGAVLVSRMATSRLTRFLAGASAVITDLGSPTGHFAAVARDFRVPTIVATGEATKILAEGVKVTVDAEENTIYEGQINELLRYQLLKRSSFEDTSEFRLLRRILRAVTPLTLQDPQHPDFTASRCRTYHDIIRFAHEKAVVQLLDIGWVKARGEQPHLRRLDLAIPLDLILIDLGGGFLARPRSKAKLEDVTSLPLRPLLEALTSEGIWETAPADMDLDGFMSSATRSMTLTAPLAGRPTQNLAIVSGEYMHLSLRLGYHFNIVDAYLGDVPADNYIYFRFAGGVTELTRRSRRAILLKQILEGYGFVTEGREDLVIGRMKGVAAEAMTEQMRMIGRLIGFTRQLDVFLRNDRLVTRYVERFLGKGRVSPETPSYTATEAAMSSNPDVMVLDDEEMVCDRLEDHLGKKGYNIEVFTDSQQAIDRLADKRFDVVITDLKMAGPSGLDILRFVRDNNFGTQVIIITGYGTFEEARKAEYMGAYEFVSKPFSVKNLEALTQKAAKKARKLEKKGA